MGEWQAVGRLLVLIGLGIMGIGLLLTLVDRIPWLGGGLGWFGKLPGDISVKKDNVSFYFPIGTSLVVSIVLSLLFAILSWLFRR